uniref:BZIP domain-containing protein n=1 Tax=Rhabditophanes sp. KR3021 TaxID=114890 RepID=A0AC35TYF0_9BILA
MTSNTIVKMDTSSNAIFPEDSINVSGKRWREKRIIGHHHHHTHVRVSARSCDKRKLREKRKANNAPFLSTDGTTSGEDGENIMIHENVTIPSPGKLTANHFRKQHLVSDLEADCEDNNSTDVDAISFSGSVKQNNTEDCSLDALSEININNDNHHSQNINCLNTIIKKLEQQLEVVLRHNTKLKEENEKLKNQKAD